MSTVHRFKVASCKQGSSGWDVQWFNTQEETKTYTQALLKNDPEHIVKVCDIEYEVHPDRKTVKTLRLPIQGTKYHITYQIKSHKDGIYTVEANEMNLEGEFSSIEDAERAIDNFSRAPFMYAGL